MAWFASVPYPLISSALPGPDAGGTLKYPDGMMQCWAPAPDAGALTTRCVVNAVFVIAAGSE